jgi:hypothetical protein
MAPPPALSPTKQGVYGMNEYEENNLKEEDLWDEIEIGNVPLKESAVSIMEKGYAGKAKKEAFQFKNQLLRKFGKKNGVEFHVRKVKQENGVYFVVVMLYNVRSWEAQQTAFIEVEENIPEYWDEVAKKYFNLTN